MNIYDVLNCYEDNSKVLDEIVKACIMNKLIPFVGAGFSQPIYPGWKKTLKELASKGPDSLKTDIDELLCDSKFEEAADLIYKKIGKGEFEKTFKNIFSPEKIENIGLSNNIKLLAKVFPNAVVTTNFDRCLEFAYKEEGDEFDTTIMPRDKESLENYLTQITRDNPHYLWKIHGDISNFNQRVFTTEEYDKVYGDKGNCQKAFENFFSNNKLIFLGCSLSGNDRYKKILEEKGKTADLTNYAIMKRPENDNEFEDLKKNLSDHWIFPIWYPYSDTEHEAVSVVLKEILSRIEKEKQTVKDIDPLFKKKNVRQLIEKELRSKNIKISIPEKDFITLDDVVAICLGKNSNYSTDGLESELFSILGGIYDSKYSKFTYDKDIRKNKEWKTLFENILKRYNIDTISTKKTLVVGVGNGEEGKYFGYSNIADNDNLILTDIAVKSLKEAVNKFPKAISINQPAQNLSRIGTSSIDVYISTRVYQSTYFNIEKALYEATRVLKYRGLLILSISNGFLDAEDGSYIRGLLNADGLTIDNNKPKRYIERIEDKLKTLNYKKITIDECKSEIYISAIKGN